MTLEEKKALLAELLEKHGPGDGAVTELKAEIDQLERHKDKPAPGMARSKKDD